LSVADTVIFVFFAPTVEPLAGLAMATVGGVVSTTTTLLTLTVTEACPTFDAASYAFTMSVWFPLATLVVLQEKENGDEAVEDISWLST